ncbi:MAG: ABC transporter permease subunit [Bacteroidales bacterium]
MNRNLFRMELKRNVTSLAIWSLVICALIWLTMMIYPTFLANQSKITGMLSIVPKEALQFKGISNINDLLSVLGFYASNNVIFMMLLGSVFSIVLSSGILLKEEFNKTAEYLLTRPITRLEVFSTKLTVVFIWIVALNLVTSITGWVVMEIVRTGPYDFSAFIVLSVNTLLLNLLFGSLGLFISVIVRRAKPVTSFCIGLVLVFYFIYTISKIAPGYSSLGYISPFRYAGLDLTSLGSGFKTWNLLYFLFVTILLVTLSWRIYRRKDIYI